MKTHGQDELAIAQQAAEWLTVLEDAGPTERTAFAQWLVRSPVHVREFLNLTAVHRLFDGIDPQRLVDVEELLRDSTNVIALREQDSPLTQYKSAKGRRVRTSSTTRWAAGMAAFGATIAAVAWWTSIGQWQRFATTTGEQRSVELDDGSLVYLGASSQLRVRFDDQARDVRLLEGEALFTVHRDSQRPFRVHAGDAVIQALGTQFNVNRRTRDTAVAVIEGAVRILAKETTQAVPILRAGETASIVTDGVIAQRGAVDTARVAAWRERRLVFQSDTLEDMAAEFNRYNRKPKIRVERSVGQRRFTGVLDANHPESLLNLLAEADDLASERRGDELLIRARHH